MTCAIEGCGKRIKAKGLCSMHYYRVQKYGVFDYSRFQRATDGEPMKFLMSLPVDGDGCRFWPYAKNNMGYGQVNIGDGKRVLAHRISCERRNGSPPTISHQAAHSCGNGHIGCVAPWHLSWKTAAENNLDQDTHGTRSWGEKHASILTRGDVIEIRRSHGVSQSELADRFGVSQSMISRIKTRKAWNRI